MRQPIPLAPRCPHNKLTARTCVLCQTELQFGNKFSDKFPKHTTGVKVADSAVSKAPKVEDSAPPYRKVIHPVTKSWTKLNKDK